MGYCFQFYYLLSKENLIAKDGESEIEKLYRNNAEEEEKISNKFYAEYKTARNHLFEHLKKNNPEKDEMLLLEKTQKILDRFIFVCFCEDKGLLPARIFRGTLEQVKKHLEFWDAYKSILENIKALDPACGSGAFLNQAFDYLYGEGQRVNKEIAKLKRGTYSLVELDKSILSNNLYGVDFFIERGLQKLRKEGYIS